MAELLTTAQLAKRLQVSPGTIRDWARDGRIPQIRLSQKSRRFPSRRCPGSTEPKSGGAPMTALRATIQPSVPRLALRDHEAAEALGISRRTLWEWTRPQREDPIPFVQMPGKNGKPGRRLYPVRELADWLTRQAARQPGEGATCLTSAPHDGGAGMSRPPPTVQEKLRLIRAMKRKAKTREARESMKRLQMVVRRRGK